jgi:predicted dehydrogenase
MNTEVKIAVVGCGYWGTNHARTLSELGALAAVSDLNADNAQKAADNFNVPQKTLSDILDDKEIDGVVFAHRRNKTLQRCQTNSNHSQRSQ